MSPRTVRSELQSPFAWDRYLQKLEVEHYNVAATQEWAQSLWPWIFGLSFAYVVLCFLGVRYMKDREKFQLRRTLVLWNAGLAAYSAFGLWRMIPNFMLLVREGRYSDLACSVDYFYEIGPWGFLFPFSKLFEFGDTLFVVLKKKKLIFLHWYHHITVLWFCWYSLVYPIGPGYMFSFVNLFVHTVMYTYYGLVASGLVRLPRWVNIVVTTLQIAQMFVGIYVTSFAYYRVYSGMTCSMHFSHFALSMAMYTSYAILFGNYFYNTYVCCKPVSAMQEQAPKAELATPEPKTNGRSNGDYRKTANGVRGRNGAARHSKAD